MIGQYTKDELISMGHIISTLKQEHKDGIIIRQIGNTVNYYRKESDDSYTNYDCKTKYR